jgi:hypothetical protein
MTAPGFRFGLPDLNDGTPWTEMDGRYLKDALEHGSTIEEAAGHLCRSGTVDAVAKKASELGLQWRAAPNLAARPLEAPRTPSSGALMSLSEQRSV